MSVSAMIKLFAPVGRVLLKSLYLSRLSLVKVTSVEAGLGSGVSICKTDGAVLLADAATVAWAGLKSEELASKFKFCSEVLTCIAGRVEPSGIAGDVASGVLWICTVCDEGIANGSLESRPGVLLLKA